MKDVTPLHSRFADLTFIDKSFLVSFSKFRKGLSPSISVCAIVLLYFDDFFFFNPSFCERVLLAEDGLLALFLFGLCLIEKSKSSRVYS